MKLKTDIKAGTGVQAFLNESGRVVKQTGRATGQAAQSVAKTVTSRKFWTWPW
jgi:hypothetical protein